MAAQLPMQVAIIQCKVHHYTPSAVALGNNRAYWEAKLAASTIPSNTGAIPTLTTKPNTQLLS